MTIVLVANGNSAMRAVLKMALAKLPGTAIFEAGGGRDALAKLRVLSPALVITAVDLPEIGGVALTKRIRAEKSAEEVPVFLIAGLHERDEVNKGLAAGANGYFTTPLDTVELVAAIGRHVVNR